MKLSEYELRFRRELLTLAFWRDLLVELLGTFIYVAVAVAVNRAGTTTSSANPLLYGLAIGLVYMTLVYSLGQVGGGHFNPVVSLCRALALDITISRGTLL